MNKSYRLSHYRCDHSKYSDNLVLTLTQVTPVQNHTVYLQVFNYKRIKTENLDIEGIKRIYELQNAKAINVLETPNFFLIQYPGKPIIYLNKKDGRLYSLKGDGFTQEEHEFQASFVIRMLHKWGYVEELHSKRIGRKIENRKNFLKHIFQKDNELRSQ